MNEIEFRRKVRPIIIRARNEFGLTLPPGVEEIRIDIGPENKIYWYEEILAINDITFVLDVKLTGADQVGWFLEQLKRGAMSEWCDEHSFGDRRSINERYGFI